MLNLFTNWYYNLEEKKKYGWIKDKEDNRDIYKNFNKFNNFNNIDLRINMPNIYTQGSLGSCTANAIAGAYEYIQIIQKNKSIFTPSRLFIYYNERNIENTINLDSGAQIRDGIKTLNKIGIIPECDWPYDISKFKVKPNDKLYIEANKFKTKKYKKILQDLNHLKQALNDGYPIIFGFKVYESFESKQIKNTGEMIIPKKNEKILGGHAVLAVGYIEDKKVFIIRNSWGEQWGDKGYFYMPYSYILNKKLANDMWIIDHVPNN